MALLARPIWRCDPGDLFELFTETARQVVVYAQEEARRLGHRHIGTEHELLGLLQIREGPAAETLGSLGITLEHVREQVVRLVGSGEEASSGQIPFTPRAKKVLELSLREALSLGHKNIGPEHLLLGLLSASDGTANRILTEFGAEPETIRSRLLPLLPGPDPEAAQPQQPIAATLRTVAAQAEPGVAFRVTPTAESRRLLTAAAGRALADGRTEFAINDLLMTLSQSAETAGLLADFGITEQTMRKAIEKHRI